MSNIQATEKLTKGHSFPGKDVKFKSYKFDSFHKRIMDAATRWAKSKDGSNYGDERRQEAVTYMQALQLVLVGTVPEEVYDGIYEEYHIMFFGKSQS